MTGLVVGFERGQGLSSRAIEYFKGEYSHTTTLWDDSHVLDSRLSGGVQIRPLSSLPLNHMTWLELPMTAEQVAKAQDALKSQLGKPYDVLGIWHFVTDDNSDRNWRDESAWFCDELAVWSWEQSGFCPKLLIAPNRITPGGSALVASALGGTEVHLP